LTVYTPDALNRIWNTTVYYAADLTTNVQTQIFLDAAGNTANTLRIGTDGAGSSTVATLPVRAYDQSGRVVLEQNALGGVTTTVIGSTATGGREVITTYPDGGTRIEDYYCDGRPSKTTGTAVKPVQYGYGLDPASGELYTTVTNLDTAGNPTPEWVGTRTDFQGRDHLTLYPDNASSQQYYQANGQLWMTSDPDGVLTVYTYNDRGEVEDTMTGLATAPATPPAGPITSGDHRITQVDSAVGSYTEGAATYPAMVTTNVEYTTSNSPATLITSESFASLDGLRQWTVAFPGTTFSQVMKSVTQYGPGGVRTVTTTRPDNTVQVSTYSHGRPVTTVSYDANGVQIGGTSVQYNQQGLMGASVDARNGTTTFVYNHADQATTNTTPAPAIGQAPQVTTTVYDLMGRSLQVTAPDGAVGYARYYPNGLTRLTWGARTYPSGYTYDAQGRPSQLFTWQAFTAPAPANPAPAFPGGAETTAWNYDPLRGWLLNKRYPDHTGPDYTYTAGGRLRSRLWARSVPGAPGTRLTTTYHYDFDAGYNNAGYQAGYLAATSYNDFTTPGLTFTYDRLGRQQTIVQGGALKEAEFDLVVLAVGVQPNLDTKSLFGDNDLQHDAYFYVEEIDEDLNPGETSIPGVFVAGAASGAKDIPESILHAGAAVAQAAAYVEAMKVGV